MSVEPAHLVWERTQRMGATPCLIVVPARVITADRCPAYASPVAPIRLHVGQRRSRRRPSLQVRDDGDDGLVLRGEVRLQAYALLKHRFGVAVRLDGTLVAGRPEDLLPNHDHDHEDELGQAGEEEEEGEGIGVEADDTRPRQGDPAKLEDSRAIKSPHRAHLLGEVGADPSVDADGCGAARGRLRLLCLLDQGRGRGVAEPDPGAQQRVLRHEVRTELPDLVQDRLRVLIGLHRAALRRRPQHLLTDEDDEDEKQLDDVPEEEKKGKGVPVEAQRPELGQEHPGEDEGCRDIDDPHGADAAGHPGGQPPVKAAVHVAPLRRPLLSAGGDTGMRDVGKQLRRGHDTTITGVGQGPEIVNPCLHPHVF